MWCYPITYTAFENEMMRHGIKILFSFSRTLHFVRAGNYYYLVDNRFGDVLMFDKDISKVLEKIKREMITAATGMKVTEIEEGIIIGEDVKVGFGKTWFLATKGIFIENSAFTSVVMYKLCNKVE